MTRAGGGDCYAARMEQQNPGPGQERGVGTGAAHQVATGDYVVNRDVPCVGCSYNLRGLPIHRNCPECGEPISNSATGILLEDAPPEYVMKIRGGLSLVLNGILAAIVFGLLAGVMGFAFAGQHTWLVPLLNIGGFIVGAVMLLGYWKFTEPDPVMEAIEQPTADRKVIRVTLMVSLGVSVLQLFTGLLVQTGSAGNSAALPASVLGIALGIISLVLWVIQFISVMNYTAWIGGRVPDEFVVRRAKMYRWLLPVIYVVGAIVVIGPLIALIMYWNLLDRVRKHLKSIESTGLAADLPGRLG